ncbi:homeobox protein prospero isoform X4 [Sitodiplosis mosellana]|uniref:homeobox protein prospero isoform X4 n=1 Tax=Sitodiplosis mosellana TaxID=263140 RepID=UPI002443AB73|nr:homeobox protein prospero isoform X4 [Sitodiplosis mosellana]XP_055313397.1 homeobox protein prospero isoform X4 [Sitodiplosis mosellana]XP_055313398.1 homeobox protein prospero isoform X4 [Sitodiplosis mosellana]
MMSSEEDADSFGLYGDKLLKKAKRARQRVDAGEPRNSYSSIPNFSSRPSLMSGGLYGAIYSQNQQQHNFGLFNSSGYGTSTSKMLNELLARQVKQAQDAGGPETNMMLSPMEGASNSDGSKHGFETTSPIIRRQSSGGVDLDDTTVQANDLEKLHMLRNILQGKKELMALHDHELRAAAAASAASMNNSIERASPDNNNSISKNNNTNSNNNIVKQEVNIKSETLGNGGSDANDTSEINVNNRVNSMSNQMNDDVSRHMDNGEDMSDNRQDNAISGDLNKALNDNMIDEEMICLNSRSDSENSMPSSPGSDMIGSKDDMDIEMHLDKNNVSPIPQSLKNEPVAMDMKRARVENIVNTMRSSPILPSQQHPQVNGCKKRKLYQPQQHDAERYSGLNFNLGLQGLMFGDGDDDEDDEQPPVQQKRVEKSALESELRSLQEKLAEMQQKYVQLCTIVNEHSEVPELSQEIDDGNSDTFEPIENKKETPEKQPIQRHSVSSSPTISPMKDLSLNSKVSNASNMMLSQVMGKMISSKLHNPAQLAPNFNGTHPLLQHINMTHNSHEHALQQMQHNQQQQQNALNQAAMYFGAMNPKFFLEQEVRNSKESAEQQKQQSQQRDSVAQQLERERQQQQNSNQTAGHSSSQLKQAQMQQQERERPMQNSNQSQTHSPQQKECSQSQRTQEQSSNAHGQPSQVAMQAQQQQNSLSLITKMSTSDLSERLNIGRSNSSSVGPVSGTDLEGLADVLKSEITASLSNLVDSIVTRFVHQRRFLNKQSEAAAAAAEQLNKDLMMATQLLDRKSPRTKVADRSSNVQTAAMFQTPKPPQVINPVAAAALYNSMNVLGGQVNQFCMPESRDTNPEQNEALSLVVQPKKKRHKVTDTRITPRTVSRILAQDGIGPAANQQQIESNTNANMNNNNNNNSTNGKGSIASGKFILMNTSTTTPSESPSPRSSYHGPPPSSMLQALSTSVAIPNPSLHESQVFSPYSPFFNHHNGPHAPQQAQVHHLKMPASPPGFAGMMDPRDSPPLPHPPTMLHPALLVPPPQDYAHIRAAMDNNDRNSDCNSADISFDGLQPTISFSNDRKQQMLSLTSVNSSTLTPMHLRKAKLMFFWVRYPSSAVLKMYFPDIKFNKNNTAQLVKWFSNFREFYYIQMEKYARQAVSEGIKSPDDLHISGDSEIYRVLNLHYNRNNHIEVPLRFREVVEQTLREFYRSIQGGKDTEQSWKKSIYKVISRMDDSVPEYFKSPNFLEQLE